MTIEELEKTRTVITSKDKMAFASKVMDELWNLRPLCWKKEHVPALQAWGQFIPPLFIYFKEILGLSEEEIDNLWRMLSPWEPEDGWTSCKGNDSYRLLDGTKITWNGYCEGWKID